MVSKIMDVGCEQVGSTLGLGRRLTFRGPVKSWLPQCLTV